MKNILQARLTKVDETTGQFWGIAAAEIPDQKGEICDYAGSKPFIKAWSDDISVHSGGKSLGNLRAQHNSKVAVGRILDIAFNDAAKQVEVHGEVVDSVELEKLAKGLYTGLSFGGEYGKKWRDGDGNLRYEAKPIELSLADRPASTATRFTLVKVDGSEVEMEFQQAAEAGDLKVAGAGDLQKRFDHVGQMAGLLSSFRCLLAGVVDEALEEKDNSPIPARMKASFIDLVAIFKEFVAEEAGEAIAGVEKLLEAPLDEALRQAFGGPLVRMADAGELQKVGATISAKNKDHAQQIHDHAAALGATCGGETMNKVAEAETLAKVAALEADIAAKDEELAKVAGEKDAALAQVAEKDEALTKVAGEKAALQTEVDELKKQPAPAKGALREGLHAPSKEEDGLEKTAAAKEPETPLEAVKLAHQKPFIINGR